MIELKTRTERDAMGAAGRVVASVLVAVRAHARVGTALRELDELARSIIHESGAVPVLLGDHPTWAPSPFPAALSTSINDAIVRGIPGRARLVEGDLVSIDCGVSVQGWCASSAITFSVGAARQVDVDLVRATQQALDDGIAAAQPENRTGDVSRAIGVVGRSGGYGIPATLGGHGIGRDQREPPWVPNDGRSGDGMPLRPGMVLVFAPMFLAGGRDSIQTGENGRTRYTEDGTRAAHIAHTVAISEQGPFVLTMPGDVVSG